MQHLYEVIINQNQFILKLYKINIEAVTYIIINMLLKFLVFGQ